MKVIKTAKAIKLQQSFDVEVNQIKDFDVNDVKIGDEVWSFYVDGESVEYEMPLEDVIISGVAGNNPEATEIYGGQDVLTQLRRNPAFDEEYLWNVIKEESMEAADQSRIDRYESKNRIGPYADIEEPDYGPDPVRPEF